MPQLTFTWPAETSYAAEDYILSASNAQAVKFLDSWPEENGSSAALLSGPASAGKSHLAQRWALRVGACFIDGAKLGTLPSDHLWSPARPGVLEDIHTVTDEATLFHLLRHAEAHGLFLLMTARAEAKALPITLPDLRSRLLALSSSQLPAPDETLLQVFLAKCFSDRQLRVPEDVTLYLARRMERSFAEALALVERIERLSAQSKRPVTIPLVRKLVEKHAG